MQQKILFLKCLQNRNPHELLLRIHTFISTNVKEKMLSVILSPVLGPNDIIDISNPTKLTKIESVEDFIDQLIQKTLIDIDFLLIDLLLPTRDKSQIKTLLNEKRLLIFVCLPFETLSDIKKKAMDSKIRIKNQSNLNLVFSCKQLISNETIYNQIAGTILKIEETTNSLLRNWEEFSQNNRNNNNKYKLYTLTKIDHQLPDKKENSIKKIPKTFSLERYSLINMTPLIINNIEDKKHHCTQSPFAYNTITTEGKPNNFLLPEKNVIISNHPLRNPLEKYRKKWQELMKEIFFNAGSLDTKNMRRCEADLAKLESFQMIIEKIFHFQRKIIHQEFTDKITEMMTVSKVLSLSENDKDNLDFYNLQDKIAPSIDEFLLLNEQLTHILDFVSLIENSFHIIPKARTKNFLFLSVFKFFKNLSKIEHLKNQTEKKGRRIYNIRFERTYKKQKNHEIIFNQEVMHTVEKKEKQLFIIKIGGERLSAIMIISVMMKRILETYLCMKEENIQNDLEKFIFNLLFLFKNSLK